MGGCLGLPVLSPELHSEAEFAETLLAGSPGLCLTMHN